MSESKINTLVGIIMLLLAIPAGAIIVSANAIPGDLSYPLKLSLEKIATILLSPSYRSRSDLELKLIERRIFENQQLMQKNGSTQGLKTLVAQAKTAKEYVIKTQANTDQKKSATQKLISTLKQTNSSLEIVKQSLTNQSNQPPSQNPTISQGNSPIKPQPTQPPWQQPDPNPTDENNNEDEINEAQEQIIEIIEELEDIKTDESPTTSTSPTHNPELNPSPSPSAGQTQTESGRPNQNNEFIIENPAASPSGNPRDQN